MQTTNIPQETLAPGCVRRGRGGLSAWLAVALTAIAYTPVFKNRLTNWDDGLYILNNPYLASLSLENLGNIFTSFHAGNYHPLPLVTMALDYQMGGIHPWPYQLTNLVLHLANTHLVFLFVRSLLELRSLPAAIPLKQRSLIPLVSALLFGLHTLQVESVAWMSEQKTVLCAFFFFASAIAYVKYVQDPSRRAYLSSLGLFILSLLSKGTAVTLPLCLLVIDYYARRPLRPKNVIGEKAPFFLLSLVFGILAIVAQHSGGALDANNGYRWPGRIAVAGYAFIQYLAKLCVPVHLSAYYPYPVQPGTPLPWQFPLSAALVLLLAFGVWRYFRRSRAALFGLAFFAANISVGIQLLPVGDAIMADRYAYVGSVGFFFLLACCCGHVAAMGRWSSRAALTVLAVYCLFLGANTWRRVGVWKDSLTLWNDALSACPENNDRGHLNRGTVFYEMGDYAAALRDFNQALLTKPPNSNKAYSRAYVARALVKEALGDRQGAMNDYYLAIAHRESCEAYLNRAVLKMNLADIAGARIDLAKAAQLDPSRPEPRINRGVLELNSGHSSNALAELNQAVALGRNNAQAYLYRAIVHLSMTNDTAALADLDRSIQLHPGPEAYYYRGIANIRFGRHSAGCSDLKRAAALGHPQAAADYQKHCR